MSNKPYSIRFNNIHPITTCALALLSGCEWKLSDSPQKTPLKQLQVISSASSSPSEGKAGQLLVTYELSAPPYCVAVYLSLRSWCIQLRKKCVIQEEYIRFQVTQFKQQLIRLLCNMCAMLLSLYPFHVHSKSTSQLKIDQRNWICFAKTLPTLKYGGLYLWDQSL